MPISLAPLSRRRFLRGTVAAGAALLAPRWVYAQETPADPHRFALLSDTHIHEDKAFNKSSTTPWDTLGQAVTQILAGKRPSAVLVNGDCAAHQGNAGDYATFIQAIAPLRKAGLPIHLNMGNHDHRANFWEALPADEARQKALDDRQVCLIEAPRANILMLDSLDVTLKTPGVLGEKQLAWLGGALDARPDKPALIFIHHNPSLAVENNTALTDTKAFYDLILPRKQVKAYIFGHTHQWSHKEHEGLHLINLPPTAWLFKKDMPRGWVDLTLTEGGATFELQSLDPAHPLHREKAELKWRV